MAHIAVNTRLLLPGRLEGISRFAWEVLQRMALRNPDVQFSFFFDRAFDPVYIPADNVRAYVIPPPARHPLLWIAWFGYQVPRKLDQIGADLFFSPEFYLSAHPTLPQVPVFHDLAYEHYPEDIRPFASWYCRRYSPIFAHRAAHILTVSEFSKQDIINHYQLPGEKISVVHNGSSEGFWPIGAEEQQNIRDQYAQGQPFFHFVGTLQPRKNLENLLSAFDQFKSQHPNPLKLLIIGRKGWQFGSTLTAFANLKHKQDVLFTGFVPDEELRKIYSASHALCYVPFLEGFGIPLLEAMHSETAIITSNVSAIPEVAGDAALMVDPHEITQIAQAMQRLWQSPQLRSELIEKGRTQREKFSCDQTYEKVWQVLSSYL